MAYTMTPDLNHKFDLALMLNLVEDAYKIAEQQQSVEKWKKVGDIALSRGSFALAETCYDKSSDFNSLLLFYSSYGDLEGLKRLAERAELAGKYNVAYEAAFVIGDANMCLSILLKAKRMGEAAYFARAYLPSRLAEVTKLWGDFLKEQGLPFYPESETVVEQRIQEE